MVNVIFLHPHEHKELKDMKIVDMHCHTDISDGRNTAEEMIEKAKKLNIGISITDHNEIDATIKACKYTFAIPGIEATSSDAIDFLFYFYNHKELEEFYHKHIKHKHLKSRGFDLRKLDIGTEELLDYMKDYNCLIVLPHPFTFRPKNSHRYIQKNPKMLKYIDGIEAINSVMNLYSNEKATAWAKELNTAATGGSDAHMKKFLGRAVTASYAETVEEFLDNIKKRKNIVVGKSLNTFAKLHAHVAIFTRNLRW